ncbi:MAG TPA: hypothetical protein VNO33_07210, partial [Kofleriaceae bacterium]|nr:hypothetical protein [Kofleriaceae bacterium]
MTLAPTRRIDVLLIAVALTIAAVAVAAPFPVLDTPDRPTEPAASLRDTGLYADWDSKAVAAGNLPFAPQYPLWTDGAAKRRWIRIPPGTAIDASRPDAWQFPVGTRMWKEFAFGGRRVETRLMELTSRGWIFASYMWNEDESDAVLAPARGAHSRAQVAPGIAHAIPSEPDCHACHDGAAPVLGFSALQLSPDRDPGALHAEPPPPGAVDLASLVARGLVRGLPESMLRTPPRIAAASPTERAALGYLHGNCGGCHGAGGALASLGLTLAYTVEPDGDRAAARDSTFARPSRFALPGAPAGAPSLRVAPGRPDQSVLLARMGSASPISRMPPLGTRVV